MFDVSFVQLRGFEFLGGRAAACFRVIDIHVNAMSGGTLLQAPRLSFPYLPSEELAL
jgi:hypothetical protein